MRGKHEMIIQEKGSQKDFETKSAHKNSVDECEDLIQGVKAKFVHFEF